ncbi:MAG: phosphatidylglycerophosphatase A [Fluviibacter sp.]|jgi:phosphatidylglycerophosphatase A
MTENAPTPRQPTVRFMLSHPLHVIALGFGSGLSPYAPGTIGTLFAWASFRALDLVLSTETFLLAILLSFVVGIVAIEKTGPELGEIDHGSIVWDEIVPFWGILWALALVMGDNLLWQGVAFTLFRLFDITKPWPACYYDRKVKNGYGVMMDDVAAAVYTLIALTILLLMTYLGTH